MEIVPHETPQPILSEIKTQATEALRDPRQALEKVMWEVRRRLMLVEFSHAGFAEPDKAIEVVAWLEENTKTREWKADFFGSTLQRSVSEKWKYQRRNHLESVRKLSQGVENPTELLATMGEFVNLEDHLVGKRTKENHDRYDSLWTLANYVDVVKKQPHQDRLQQMAAKMNECGIKLKKIELLRISIEDGADGKKATIGSDCLDEKAHEVYVPDALTWALNLSDEEFNQLTSENTLGRATEMHRDLKEMGEKQLIQAEVKKPIFSWRDLPEMLQICATEPTRVMFLQAASNLIYWIDDGHSAGRAAREMLQILDMAPELRDLFAQGFYVGNFLRAENGYGRVNHHGHIAELVATFPRERFHAALADEKICAQMRLLAEYGLHDYEYFSDKTDRRPYEEVFYQEAEISDLEKQLIIWTEERKIMGDEWSRYPRMADFYKQAGVNHFFTKIADDFSAEELKAFFAQKWPEILKTTGVENLAKSEAEKAMPVMMFLGLGGYEFSSNWVETELSGKNDLRQALLRMNEATPKDVAMLRDVYHISPEDYGYLTSASLVMLRDVSEIGQPIERVFWQILFQKSKANFTFIYENIDRRYFDYRNTQDRIFLLRMTSCPDVHFLQRVLAMTGPGYGLSRERALAAWGAIGDLYQAHQVFQDEACFNFLLTSDDNTVYLRRLQAVFPEEIDFSNVARLFVKLTPEQDTKTVRESLLEFPVNAPLLMRNDFTRMRNFVFAKPAVFLQNIEEVKFANTLAARFGRPANSLLVDYAECVETGEFTQAPKDKEIFLELAGQFRAVSPAILKGYRAAKQSGTKEIYLAGLNAIAERMTSALSLTEEERKKPYYLDLVRAVYPNNSDKFGDYASVGTCSDRQNDLERFPQIRPRYEIDLLAAVEVKLKNGEKLDYETINSLKNQVLQVAEAYSQFGFDKSEAQKRLNAELDGLVAQVKAAPEFANFDERAFSKTEEKLFFVLTAATFGEVAIEPAVLKHLMINFEFAEYEDVRTYIQGTTDRVSRSLNQDYGLLMELAVFFSDQIKNVNNKVMRAGWENKKLRELMPQMFTKLSERSGQAARQAEIARLRVDTLGLTPAFIAQIRRELTAHSGREYSEEQIVAIISRYERMAGGLAANLEKKKVQKGSREAAVRAFYGQLRTQREKTRLAMQVITGQNVDPQDLQLGQVNLQAYLEAQSALGAGIYDEQMFGSYVAQRFVNLFATEQEAAAHEMAKYESVGGGERQVLNAFITKTKESAYARLSGGVCVCADNPGRNPQENMWDLPNYLQMVFQDPETLRCQGLVLMHDFNESGEKILSVSLNPSETYLLSTDEEALFKGIMKQLEVFANENGFNKIVVSKNFSIRTNRVGGMFEKALEAKIRAINKTYTFKDLKTFSFYPSHYQLQEMDVLWEKGLE